MYKNFFDAIFHFEISLIDFTSQFTVINVAYVVKKH